MAESRHSKGFAGVTGIRSCPLEPTGSHEADPGHLGLRGEVKGCVRCWGWGGRGLEQVLAGITVRVLQAASL